MGVFCPTFITSGSIGTRYAAKDSLAAGRPEYVFGLLLLLAVLQLRMSSATTVKLHGASLRRSGFALLPAERSVLVPAPGTMQHLPRPLGRLL